MTGMELLQTGRQIHGLHLARPFFRQHKHGPLGVFARADTHHVGLPTVDQRQTPDPACALFLPYDRLDQKMNSGSRTAS